MLSSFPIPYPDELLYSTLARYHARSGEISPKATLQELFHRTTAYAVFDLPCNLDALLNNLPKYWGYTAKDFIYNNTLFPLYAPFITVKRADLIYKAMRGNNGNAIHTQTGIMACAIKENRYFKFCPMCSTEDKMNYGELYWHRVHQVPGILICPLHKQILLDSTVPIHGQYKHEFYAAVEENCPVKPISVNYSDATWDHMKSLATDIEWLLLNPVSPSQDLNWYRERYVSILIDKGLATCKGRFYINELTDTLVEFYGQEFLEAVQSQIDPNQENNWLLSIVRKHRKSFHPISHSLMMDFLVGSAERFFQKPIEYRPFGDAPWPCLNGAANHYRESVVTEMAVTHCADTKRPVGTFSCDCGFIYSRRGPDQTENDRYKIGRVKAFGFEWEEKLRELLSLKDLSFREIARRLKVDTNTVIKYSKKMDEDFATNPPETPSLNMQQKDACRNIWLKLSKEYPELSKTALRKMNQDAYAWLYRHNRDWLNENSPLQSKHYKNTRVDWALRDREVLQIVKQCVFGEMLSPKSPRITVGRIGRKINLLAILEKHIDKMPETKAYLETVCETVEDYQIRRVVRVAHKLRTENENPQKWKILRLAGIRPGYSSAVAKTLEDEDNYCIPLSPDFKQNTSNLYLS